MKIILGKKSRRTWTHFITRVPAALIFFSIASVVCAAESHLVEFSIQEQRVDRALTQFARQSGMSVLFPYDKVREFTANRLVGTYEIAEGLDVLLRNTGLKAGVRDGERLLVQVEGGGESTVEDPPPKGLLSTLLSVLTSPLRAGTTAAEIPDQNVMKLEEIMVTGSRIRGNGYNSAQPTTVISREMQEVLGLSNVGEVMELLPANLGNWTPTAKPGGNESFPLNVFNGLHLANLRGLNPVYGSRTLALVDSRRHTPTNQGDGVDLNMIPAILIERMEIVTGGASASYGSGSIAGVVNILLNHGLDGGRAEVNYGGTDRGDGLDRYYGFAWGAPTRNGHLVLGLEMQDMDPIENCIETRDWCARGASIRENRQYETTPEPNYVFREDVHFNMSERGVFTGLGREFNDAGTELIPFQNSDGFQVGGDGQHVYLDTTLRTNVDRKVAYAGYERQLNEDLFLFFESAYGSVRSWTPQDSIDLYWAPLKPDNFYLNRLASNPCAMVPDKCLISKDFSAQVNTVNDTRTNQHRVAFGMGGRFGASSWTWDTYYQHGKSSMLEAVHNSRHALRMTFALDAVDDGTGHPVCRAVRDGIDAEFDGDPRIADGCVPINIFGTENITPEAFDYSWGRILENTEVEQDMVEFVSSGDLFENFGAGPVKAAAGISWRDESLENIADINQPDYLRTDYNSQFGETFGGEVEVLEYFAELELQLTGNVDMQLAGRRSHYENRAGIGTRVEGQKFRYDIDTWKVNGNWQMNDSFVFRASRSRDVRAPNFRELYYGKVFQRGSNFGYCDNPWSGNRFEGWYTFTGDACRAELRGGIDLKPEKSTTSTLGMALTMAEHNARLAVDYYRIKIEDAISPASWFYTIDQCYLEKDPGFCSLIDGQLLDPDDPVGGFSRLDVVSSKSLNLLYYKTEGIDVAADWAHIYDFGIISTRLMASHMIKQLVQPSSTSPALLDIAGMTGAKGGGFDWESAPDWSAQWFTTFARGPFELTVQARYVSGGIKDASRSGPEEPGYNPNAADSIDNNHVPAYLVWGLTSSYDFRVWDAQIELFGSIQNLFDKDPPLIGTGIGGTNPVLFDTVGRRFRIGLRTRF